LPIVNTSKTSLQVSTKPGQLQLDALGADDRLGETMEKIKNKLLDPNEPDPAKRAAGLFAWQLIAYEVFQSLQGDQDAAEVDPVWWTPADLFWRC
jgi:hypothetical protein